MSLCIIPSKSHSVLRLSRTNQSRPLKGNSHQPLSLFPQMLAGQHAIHMHFPPNENPIQTMFWSNPNPMLSLPSAHSTEQCHPSHLIPIQLAMPALSDLPTVSRSSHPSLASRDPRFFIHHVQPGGGHSPPPSGSHFRGIHYPSDFPPLVALHWSDWAYGVTSWTLG